MLAYDPVSGAYAFSYIGYNGTMAGGGDTEATRWDQAIKYRIAFRDDDQGSRGSDANGKLLASATSSPILLPIGETA